MSVELRCGDWRDVLGDVECDALICDPPYSARTEAGVRSGSTMQDQPITEDWARAFVSSWHPRARGWIVVYGDHISARWFEEALSEVRYTFAPLPLVKNGAAPRMCADGPAPQAEWIVVARPKRSRQMAAETQPANDNAQRRCPRCKAPTSRQTGYCPPCHAWWMREYRPPYSALPALERRKSRCRATSRYLLSRGLLRRQPCACGARAEMHHPDYGNPRRVEWICRPCHRALHRRAAKRKGRAA